MISLPISDPVLIFALAMAIFLIAPLIFERVKIPGIIGLILFGALIGPNVLNLLERDFTFELLGAVGLLYLVFLAGLELDLNRFSEYRRRSIVFGLYSFGVPMALALLVMPLLGFSFAAAALIGCIIGSHTLLAFPIISRLGIVQNPAMITVVGGTLVTDTLALAILAVIAGSLQGDVSAGFFLQLFGILGLYAGVVLWLVPVVGRWFFRKIPSQAPAEFLFLMVVLFTVAWFADLAGAEPIIGAFLAGLTLNRLVPKQSPLMTRVRFVGNALFIPFFLLTVGMLVDPRVVIGSPRVWVVAGALTGLVIVGKLAGAWLTKLTFGYNREEAISMFGLSVPQAAATLAVTFVGLEIGLFGEDVVNGVIIMILITVLVGPSLLEKFGRALALQEEKKPYDPREAPERVLIPIAHPKTADALMDIAFILRGSRSQESLYPLTVVRESGEDSEARVAEAERMLAHSVVYAAGADVPVVPLTRVDRNITNGILRGIAETRSSVVVIGWDGRGTRGQHVFGTVLDQLLDQTRQMIVVATLGHPLNTTRRIVLVVPPGSDHHPGFGKTLLTLQNFASELGAEVQGLVVKDETGGYAAVWERSEISAPAEFRSVPGWGPLHQELRHGLEPEDLVIVLSARRGTVSWDRELERLPGFLADLVPESFIMLYPPEIEPGGEVAFGPEVLPESLEAERVLIGVRQTDYKEALREILETGFGAQPAELEECCSRLIDAEEQFSSEVQPGVVIPNARVDCVREPTLFLGLSKQGIAFPHATAPAHVVFVLLSPRRQKREHLRLLTKIAQTLRDEERIDTLRGSSDRDALYQWFQTVNL